MAKFKVLSTVPCFVTWEYEIEAENEEEARELFREGNWVESGGPFIGDSIDYAPQDIQIEKL